MAYRSCEIGNGKHPVLLNRSKVTLLLLATNLKLPSGVLLFRMLCFVGIVEKPKSTGDLLCDDVNIADDDDVAYTIAIFCLALFNRLLLFLIFEEG